MKIKQTLQIAIDSVVALLALVLAFFLRYDGEIPSVFLGTLPFLAIGVALGKSFINYLFGSYRKMWRYTSVDELMVLVISTGVAAVGLMTLRSLGLIRFPYSVVVVDAVLYLLGVSGVRILRRIQLAKMRSRAREAVGERVKTLFIGAGNSADALLRDLKREGAMRWDVVGILDDDPEKQGRSLHSIPVIGPTTQVEQVIRKQDVKHVVVAIPSADQDIVRDIVHRARQCKTTVQVLPRIEEVVEQRNGKRPEAETTIRLTDLIDSAEVKKTLIQGLDLKSKEETILITGGAGYIGSHLVRRLLEEDYRVRILDNFTFGEVGIEAFKDHPRLEIVEGDISNIRDVVAAVKDVKTVIALAAIVGDPACSLNAEDTLSLNYESTKVLVEACDFYGVDRLVFASSCSVYGASDNQLLTEQSPLNPVSLYARTRIMSENIILERCGNVTPVILRLSTVYGLSPRMRFDLVVNTLTVRGVVNKKFQIFGGNQWRPFVHCKDAAEAFLLAATAPREHVDGEIFNVGSSDMNFTISQVGDIVARELGDVSVEDLGMIDDPRNYRVAFDKIRQALNFAPAYDLQMGIREMIDAIQEDPNLQEFDHAIYSNLKVLQAYYRSRGLLVEG